MGVMACSRNRCETIMCDKYITDIGYVCNSCQKEFKDYIEKKHGRTIIPEGEMKKEFSDFMDSEKGFVYGDDIDVDEFFSRY